MRTRLIFLMIGWCGVFITTSCADEAPAARAYFDALSVGLDTIETQLDDIAQQAEHDAALFIKGAGFGVRGDEGLALELSMRPGAMQFYSGDRGRVDDVVLDVADENWPNDPTLRAAAAWVYQVELFAACTRLGKVPVIQQSFQLDTRRQRFMRYGSQPFHHDRWLDPIAPRKLGKQYLKGLRGVLRDITSASWDAVAATCWGASDTLGNSKRVIVVTGRSMVAYHLPEILRPWDGQVSRGDLVLAVGDHEQAGSGDWGDIDTLRQSGCGIVWIINRYNTQPGDVGASERLIDLWAAVGDGVVKVEHYDTRLGPTSGVAALAIISAIAQHCESVTSSP